MDSAFFWSVVFVVATFGLYIFIAVASRAGSTDDFYVAGHDVPPVYNGMATAADWMSAASFLSMAGIIAFAGYNGSVYLMGWTGGYVLLALLLAPYLRKFNKFTVPDFVGDRYYSQLARVVAVICALFISFTYIAGQMRGVGLAFSNFLQMPIEAGVVVGSIIVLFYATLGGMKGITYTQVAQYCVLIFAYMVPAIFISLQITGNPIPQLGFLGNFGDTGVSVIEKLDTTLVDLGFNPYTENTRTMQDVLAITMALMVGTAGLPHVIIRFFTVPKASDARLSAGWALVFIAILYTTAPAVAAFARMNFIDTVHESTYSAQVAETDATNATPGWFKSWENTNLLAWSDKNGDGKIQYAAGNAFDPVKPAFDGDARGVHGERVVTNALTDSANEVYVDRDIIVLANPEIANLPGWVIGLVIAGGLAAALSTAAGLLLVISSAVSHDLCKKVLFPGMSEKQELLTARMGAVGAVLVAIYAGINPPEFVAATVAFAFGLAAASFFPAILLGIFWKRMNKEGAVAGMVTGLVFTAAYIIHFKIGFSGAVQGVVAILLGVIALILFFAMRAQARAEGKAMPNNALAFVAGGFGLVAVLALAGVTPSVEMGTSEGWLFGISPEGIGTLGMLLNLGVSVVVALQTKAPPQEIQDLVEEIRIPTEKKHVTHAPKPAPETSPSPAE